jgi:hypothetical protein
MVTCPQKYTTLELFTFQDESHDYGWRWIELYGLKGCVNYIHVFISHFFLYRLLASIFPTRLGTLECGRRVILFPAYLERRICT